MNMTPFAKKLRLMLELLGDNADTVAETLQFLGVKGFVNNCWSCPIAEYLMLCGLISPTVTASHVVQGSYCLDFSKYKGNSDAITAFINAFDDGHYPHIVRRAS